MKKNNNNIIFSIFVINTLLASCNSDYFQTVVNYEVPIEKARLVVNAEVTAGKDTMIAYISRSRTSSEAITNAYDTLSKAVVTLYKDGTKYRDLTFVEEKDAQDGNRNTQYLFKYIALIDKDLTLSKFTLKASATGYDEVTADDVLKPLVVIKNARFELNGFTKITTIGSKQTKVVEDLIEFEFDDPAAPSDNYYVLQIVSVQADQQGNLTPRSKNFDMNQQFSAGRNGYSGRKALIPDATFDGNTFKVQVGVSAGGGKGGGPGGGGPGGGQQPSEYQIILRSVSRSTYLFETSLAAYNANNGNPFADATVLYSNVFNGYGLFSMQQRNVAVVTP